MTQGLFFSMNRTKIVLDHKLSPRSPTMAFSSVRENVTQHPVGIVLENVIANYIILIIFNLN